MASTPKPSGRGSPSTPWRSTSTRRSSSRCTSRLASTCCTASPQSLGPKTPSSGSARRWGCQPTKSQPRWRTEMSIVGRMYNMWKGFLSLFMQGVEEKHPEIAYENAINSMTEKYTRLKSAAAGLIKHRSQLEVRIEKHEHDLEEVKLHVQVAMGQNDDESAVVLLERQGELEKALDTDRKDLEQAAKDADSAKDSLRGVQSEIEKMKRERDKVIAQIRDAEARKQIHDQLEGLSVDAEVKALQNVRDYADKVKAEVKINDELKEESLDGKLSKIRAQTGNVRAQQRLEQLKAQRAGAAAPVTQTQGQTQGPTEGGGSGGKSL
ncbi:MAG: PspA/IM30 family protein [Myxococcales bacterium]|nr:PspA/IM30 family protein [Myxococcales bacterium]